MKNLALFFCLLLLYPQRAEAIPPPDLLISLWQSIMQVLGVFAAFFAAIFFGLSNYLFARFSKKQITGGIVAASLLLVGAVGGSYYSEYEAPLSPPPVNIDTTNLNGEVLSIEDVIAQEPAPKYRVWKEELLVELIDNLDTYRAKKGLLALSYTPSESYDPIKLHVLLQSHPEKFLLLDPREINEQRQFGLPNTTNHRYGDIANDILPTLDPNKKIVVLCYSGIRGYVTTNLLKNMGIKNVAYVRGGLNHWLEADLPVEGTDVFDFLGDVYPELSLSDVRSATNYKLEFTHPNFYESYRFGAENFYAELASTTETTKKIAELHDKGELILICKTTSECFDAVNFAYLFEQDGGKILGYYEIDENDTEILHESR